MSLFYILMTQQYSNSSYIKEIDTSKEQTKMTYKTKRSGLDSHTQSTFWLWDNELHLLRAVLYDFCCLAEGHALQADVV